jgi:hypothetical protein
VLHNFAWTPIQPKACLLYISSARSDTVHAAPLSPDSVRCSCFPPSDVVCTTRTICAAGILAAILYHKTAYGFAGLALHIWRQAVRVSTHRRRPRGAPSFLALGPSIPAPQVLLQSYHTSGSGAGGGDLAGQDGHYLERLLLSLTQSD